MAKTDLIEHVGYESVSYWTQGFREGCKQQVVAGGDEQSCASARPWNRQPGGVGSGVLDEQAAETSSWAGRSGAILEQIAENKHSKLVHGRRQVRFDQGFYWSEGL